FTVDLKTYPAFKWWFINRFFYWAAFNTLGTFLLFFVIDVIGLPEDQAQLYLGNLSMVIGAAILFIAIPAGKLTDKIGRKPLVEISGYMAFVGSLLIIATKNLTTLTFAGFLIGASAGIFISANFALITDIIPKKQAGHYLGVAGIASAAGSALARLIGGVLVDPINAKTNSTSAGYLIIYGIAALFYLLSALSAMRLPKSNSYQTN
ncbi:MAG: MFS transporter, partial [Chloroflexota bacterium]